MDQPKPQRPRTSAGTKGVTAVLGPTNTGKTHLAIERMLGYQTGMIGLPLRLLAREVYDRIVDRLGASSVALVTGEEKIVPAAPRFYVSTVEAMPLDIPVDFLAIDEIQIAADSERGHVFTDRLLSARGQLETMMLGSATMQGLIAQLLPGTNFISRPRFSRLGFSGPKKLTRLPRRSAVVAFSADQVYAVAELVRRQRGGAAVVLGALSPRTRNAQVGLYQAGEVDFLVATDAIGMGLNMDVDHVAFAARRKFDGQHHRQLSPAELAQIAGRAGRHMNDGTFGSTGECEEFDTDSIDRIENHRFEPARLLQWRNAELDFASLDALIASLAKHPHRDGLIRTRRGDDFAVLDHLARSDEIRGLLTGSGLVARLWEVCQVPDYRKIGIGEHATIVSRVFQFLIGESGLVPEDWLARQVAYADRTEGDIDTLANRIAHIRTWTFVANRSGWLADARHWQERTRDVEDRLSDALHDRLAQRFIDRRTSVLMKRLHEKESLLAGVTDDSEVVVEGQYVGRLDGLRFALDTSVQSGADTRALQAAAMKILSGELAGRAQSIVKEEDGVFAITDTGYVTWRGASIARLEAGDSVYRPQIRLIADEQLPAPDREAIIHRLEIWLAAHLRAVLKPLFDIVEDQSIAGLARGVGFQLVEHLGLVPRDAIAGDIQQLDQSARASLRRHGVRFGAFSVYVPALLKPQPAALRLVLFKMWQESNSGRDRGDWPAAPQAGLTSLNVGTEAPAAFYEATGYRLCGPRAVRADMLERLGDTIRPLVNWKPASEADERPPGAHISGGFLVTPAMMSLVGCSGDDFAAILIALGFERTMMPAPRVIASVAPDQTVSEETPQGDADPEVSPAAADGVESPAGSAPAPAEAAAEPPASLEEAATDPAPDGPGASAVPASGQPDASGDVAQVGQPAGESAPDAEPTEAEIAVWRPRPRHRRRADHSPARHGKRRPAAKGDVAAGRDAERPAGGRAPRRQDGERRGRRAARGAGQSDGPPRKPRREAEISEDSPFAALKVLKERLSSNPDNASS